MTGVVDPDAGVILADKALAAVLGLAKREGVQVELLDELDDSDDRQVRDGCEVVKLESKGSLIQVVTETGQ